MFDKISFPMLCIFFYYNLFVNICICIEVSHALTKFPGWHPAIFVYEPLSFLDKGTKIVSMVGSR